MQKGKDSMFLLERIIEKKIGNTLNWILACSHDWKLKGTRNPACHQTPIEKEKEQKFEDTRHRKQQKKPRNGQIFKPNPKEKDRSARNHLLGSFCLGFPLPLPLPRVLPLGVFPLALPRLHHIRRGRLSTISPGSTPTKLGLDASPPPLRLGGRRRALDLPQHCFFHGFAHQISGTDRCRSNSSQLIFGPTTARVRGGEHGGRFWRTRMSSRAQGETVGRVCDLREINRSPRPSSYNPKKTPFLFFNLRYHVPSTW